MDTSIQEYSMYIALQILDIKIKHQSGTQASTYFCIFGELYDSCTLMYGYCQPVR